MTYWCTFFPSTPRYHHLIGVLELLADLNHDFAIANDVL